MDKRYGLLLFAASVAWGSTFPLAKIPLEKITPLTYIIIRLLFGIGVLFFIVAWRKSWREFGRCWRQNPGTFLALGLLITPGSFLLEFYGILYTTALNQSILINVQAIVVVIIQVVFYKLHVRPMIWIGALIAFTGVYLIIVRPGEILFGIGTFLGDILTIFTGIGWGNHTAVGEKASRKFAPLVVIKIGRASCRERV